ncbi:hypothetical protein CEXT_208441 [Caerostris extrusa]|uniref:Uncharacterized protein n=1 Tax=Caerostris extrusa TaxID=172846 RepID=A0AAV4XRN2_CAEEX|nr:hypothetical protein CEXT_208441 [Caerostris extrusa]
MGQLPAARVTPTRRVGCEHVNAGRVVARTSALSVPVVTAELGVWSECGYLFYLKVKLALAVNFVLGVKNSSDTLCLSLREEISLSFLLTLDLGVILLELCKVHLGKNQIYLPIPPGIVASSKGWHSFGDSPVGMSEFLVEARMSSRIFSSLFAVTSCLHIPSGVTVVEAFGLQMKLPSHSLFDQKISQTHSLEKS